jgi:hypothetical protein
MSHENIMRLWNDAVAGGKLRPKLKIVVKTSSYTLTPDDFGTVFTTRGATATVNFTLPAAGASNKGEWALFANVADYPMYVLGAEDGLVIFNDLTADNIGLGDAGELIGGMFLAISDATSWIVLPIATETQTLSINSTSTASSTASSTPTATDSLSSSTSASTSASGTNTPTTTTTGTVSKTGTSTMTATVSDTMSPTASTSATTSLSASLSGTATPTRTGTRTSTGTLSKSVTATTTLSATASATGTP